MVKLTIIHLLISDVTKLKRTGKLPVNWFILQHFGPSFLPPPPKVKEVVFTPLSVCLYVCVQDISKS